MSKSYKKYKSATGVEYNFYVVVDGKEQFVSFSGPGAILIVYDPKLAKAIEENTRFKEKRIVLASVVGDVKETDTPVDPEKKEYPDVKNMGDAVEVLITEYKVPESEIVKKAQVIAKAETLGVIFPNYK